MFQERELEAATEAEEGQRGRAIARAKAALAGDGADMCQDCDQPIPAARRAALPSATRCVGCQTAYERPGGRRHA